MQGLSFGFVVDGMTHSWARLQRKANGGGTDARLSSLGSKLRLKGGFG